MNPETPEKRTNARSQFFLLQTGGQPVPFYSFRPEEAVDAVPALVVDLSDGGLQVLTATGQMLPHKNYRLELVTGGLVGSGKQFGVHAIWSRPDGVNLRTGFAFEDHAAIADEVAVLLSGSERKVLRCVLYPN